MKFYATITDIDDLDAADGVSFGTGRWGCKIEASSIDEAIKKLRKRANTEQFADCGMFALIRQLDDRGRVKRGFLDPSKIIEL